MSERQPEFLMKYNLSPLTTPSTNILNTLLEVGTEPTLRYHTNTYYTIAKTIKGSLNYYSITTNLKWNLITLTFLPTMHEVHHKPTPRHYEIYVEPLHPTNPQIFIIHMINAMIN